MNDDMTKTKMYAVPEAIASGLRLTKIRRSDGRGFFLLSQSDLRPYGVAAALRDGAREVASSEAKAMFNP